MVAPGVQFTSDWTYRGLQALILENRHLRVTVLPELGGKIWSILHKPADREMLWHNPRVPPRRAPYGATYDNWFCGGWDEVFPNDFPVEVAGEAWPDHGELWALAAGWDIVSHTADEISVALEHRGIVNPVRFRKVLSLRRDEPILHVGYEIANDGASSFRFHWKSHPAMPLGPGARLHLPARRVIDEPGFGEAFAETEFAFPHAPRVDGTTRDLREVVAPGSGEVQFWYGVDLTAGQAAIWYPDEAIGFGLRFDPSVLTSVWVFATAGGWRGLETVILEPCTGHHADLTTAIAHGTHHTLAPGETLASTIEAHVLHGPDAIAAFTGDEPR
jgi:hypothetical protein